jgi:EVE domain
MAWEVNQHTREIEVGDRLYLWETAGTGILALGEVLTPAMPQLKDSQEWRFFKVTPKHRRDDLVQRVKFAVTHLIEPSLGVEDVRKAVGELTPMKSGPMGVCFSVTPIQVAGIDRALMTRKVKPPAALD